MSALSNKGAVRFVITSLALAVVFLGGGAVWAQATPVQFTNPLTGGLPGKMASSGSRTLSGILEYPELSTLIRAASSQKKRVISIRG